MKSLKNYSFVAEAAAILLVAIAVDACSASDNGAMQPIKVEVTRSQNGYQLLRGGEPYQIKGAGLEFGGIESFAAHGGNSIRTWTTRSEVETAQDVLDNALANGVTVSLGLAMGSEHWGFDYNDEAAVTAQLNHLRDEVLKYRDHPALLTWIIGNELNYDYTNPKVYDAVDSVARMIHELDPYHPTTTTVAGISESVIDDIQTRAPHLDFISFQVYGMLFALPDLIDQFGFEGPFFVTEWGAIGHWEVDKTSWGAPIEATSTEKADTYLRGYRDILEPLEGQLIGSYVFLWGQKQERTPTWFGLFTEAGEETEAVDVMHYIWTGGWPENRSPQLSSMFLDGKNASQNVTLAAGQEYMASAGVLDHEDDSLRYRWELKPESEATEVGGKFEASIQNLNGLISDPTAARTSMSVEQPGEYRLFVYAYDGKGHAAHANIPFQVKAGDAK